MNTMNPNHTDPEELRLVQNVAGACMAVHRSPPQGKVGPLCADMSEACQALHDYRAKASAPVTPERCEPAGRFKGEQNHWLITDTGAYVFREWAWSEERQDNVWLVAGLTSEYTPELVFEKGWKWHSVASPSNTDIREPTDEAIVEFARQSDWLGTAQVSRVRELLRHFCPGSGGQNASTANSLGQENASQPAGSVQQEPSDEALIRFLRRYDLEGGFYTRMLKDALAKHHPSISDNQLKELRTIALTHDGVDLYLNDARRVVGR